MPAVISLPDNACDFYTYAEPHRLILAATYQVGVASRRPAERLHVSLDPTQWRGDIEAFVTRKVQTFLDETEAAIAAQS